MVNMKGEKNNDPLVSIAAVNFNNSKYVLQTLESIKNQEYNNFEFIIIDDCSTDNSCNLIELWIEQCEMPVRFIKNKINLGVCATCNIVLNESKGKYLSFIATDDIMMPDKTECQVEILERSNDNVCAVYSDMVLVNENGLIVKDSYYKLIGVNDSFLSNIFNEPVLDQIAFFIDRNIFPAPSIMYKKETIVKLGGWDEKLHFEDWDMNIRLIHAGYKFTWTNSKLVKYRFLQNSLSRKPNPLYLESYLMLISKYSGLSKKIDKVIGDKICHHSRLIYQLNGKMSSYWLRKSLYNSGSVKDVAYVILSTLGVNYKLIEKLKTVLRT